MKKVLSAIIAVVLCCSLAGCDEDLGEILTIGKAVITAIEASNDPDGEKVFTNNGLKMTLTKSFMDFTNTTENPDNYPILYVSETIGITADRHEISEMEQQGITDLYQYAQWRAGQDSDYAQVMERDGKWFYTYNTEDSYVLTLVLESDTHYWTILSTCPLDDASGSDMATDMWNYLLSATFTES